MTNLCLAQSGSGWCWLHEGHSGSHRTRDGREFSREDVDAYVKRGPEPEATQGPRNRTERRALKKARRK